MDLEKLQKEIAALTAAPTTKAEPKAPETQKMDAAAFSKYADEQVTKAKAEADAGKADLSKARILALKTEVDKVAKFEFRANELPTVTLYHDPDQLTTTETEVSPTSNQPDGRSNWTAKMAGFGKLLAETLGDLTPNTPPGKETKKVEEKPTVTVEDDWPTDLAAAVRKSARDDDKDYHWGRDGAPAA
jgi:hypothetical protein